MPGGNVGFAVDILLQFRHLPVGFGGVDKLGAHLFDDVGQALGKPFVEDRVLLQPLVYLGPNRVLHDLGPGLGMGQVGYLLLEVVVEDGDMLHHLADFGADALVDKLLDLGADLRPVHVGVLTQEVRPGVEADQCQPG